MPKHSRPSLSLHQVTSSCVALFPTVGGVFFGHNMKHSKGTRNSFDAMKQRCQNPNHPSYKYYGGRGISVCERWSSFENFLCDMGDRPLGHSIDRIDPSGNYEPSNCRWASSRQQSENRVKSPQVRDKKVSTALLSLMMQREYEVYDTPPDRGFAEVCPCIDIPAHEELAIVCKYLPSTRRGW